MVASPSLPSPITATLLAAIHKQRSVDLSVLLAEVADNSSNEELLGVDPVKEIARLEAMGMVSQTGDVVSLTQLGRDMAGVFFVVEPEIASGEDGIENIGDDSDEVGDWYFHQGDTPDGETVAVEPGADSDDIEPDAGEETFPASDEPEPSETGEVLPDTAEVLEAEIVSEPDAGEETFPARDEPEPSETGEVLPDTAEVLEAEIVSEPDAGEETFPARDEPEPSETGEVLPDTAEVLEAEIVDHPHVTTGQQLAVPSQWINTQITDIASLLAKDDYADAARFAAALKVYNREKLWRDEEERAALEKIDAMLNNERRGGQTPWFWSSSRSGVWIFSARIRGKKSWPTPR